MKHKTDAYIKEVIILDVFPMFTFTPYYDFTTQLCELVANSMYSL